MASRKHIPDFRDLEQKILKYILFTNKLVNGYMLKQYYFKCIGLSKNIHFFHLFLLF